MKDMKEVHNFAVKWLDKFRNQEIDYIELVDHYLADDCDALGFEMDSGEGFSKRYGSAFYDYRELKKIIDYINDIELLGSAIYSRWRYFNHWAYDGEEILEDSNRSWFVLALKRLLVLSAENNAMFKGIPKTIHIVSNNICYGPSPEPKDEIEQNLTISSEGQVKFSSFNFGYGIEKYEKGRSKDFNIEKPVAEKILNVAEKVAITASIPSTIYTYESTKITGTVTGGITKVKAYIDDTIALNGGEVDVVDGKFTMNIILSQTGSRKITIKAIAGGTVEVEKTVNVVTSVKSGQWFADYYVNNYSAIIAERNKYYSSSYSCAATASTALKMAGYGITQVLITNDVESQLINKGWKKITNMGALLPGDVVFTDKSVSNIPGTYSHVQVFIKYSNSAKTYAYITDNNGNMLNVNLYSGSWPTSVVAYRVP